MRLAGVVERKLRGPFKHKIRLQEEAEFRRRRLGLEPRDASLGEPVLGPNSTVLDGVVTWNNPRASMGIRERCPSCGVRRRVCQDPLWPLVPILRRDRIMLEGFCPPCAARLLAFMLVKGKPWLKNKREILLIKGMMR